MTLMMLEEDRVARLTLSVLGEGGNDRVGRTVAEHGAAECLRRLQSESSALARAVQQADADYRVQQAWALAAELGANFIIPSDPQWPSALNDLDDLTPVGLWTRGPLHLAEASSDSIAIVGARAATNYGERIATELAELAASALRTVVSGAAFGIDAAAHRGALAVDGATIAVLACGIDIAYPTAHAGLLGRIAETGLIISEAPPGASPAKHRFLIRNRLIAALSRQTIVVEAALRSGSLSTANWAAALGRRVLGVPGPITCATSAGVHAAIASGTMEILADVTDVITVEP